MKNKVDKSLIEDEKEKFNFVASILKKKILIGVILTFIVSVICILIDCFSSSYRLPQSNIQIKPLKADIEEFKDIWNKAIYRIKYDNTHLKINFNKYKLEKDVQKDILKYLSFNHQQLKLIKDNLESSQNIFMISPFIKWIDRKIKVSYNKPSKNLNSRELMKYVSNVINPSKAFSNNTIDTIVQLNEFCYYFDRNKDKFYRQGYTRNVQNCRKIEKILKNSGIKYQVESTYD